MKRLLVVEDEEQLARNLKVWLESSTSPFEVFVTGSGEGATELLAEQRFDLLLTDIRLPGMDGIELVRLALDRQPHLRVVVMSAYGPPELSSLASRCGAIRFLHKPLDLDELYDTLVEVSRGHEGWSGTMGGLDLLDLTQLFALSRKSGVVRVGDGHEEGLLVFVEGNLRHAQSGSLQGDQAFLTMTSWPAGRFSEEPEAKPESYPATVNQSLANLMLDAAVRRDDRLRHLWDTSSGADWDPDQPGPESVRPARDGLWPSLVARSPDVVRLLIATPPELAEREVWAAIDSLATALAAARPGVVAAGGEPGFVTLRPEAGAALQITWLSLRRRNRYLFETLAAAADVAVLVFDESDDDRRQWLGVLPPKVDRVVVSRDDDGVLDLVGPLRSLTGSAQ